jgi:hypothetical protein
VWDATVLSTASLHQGDEHGKAQLHRLDVAVARLPGGLDTGATLHAVLGIGDILVWIRIRIHKSVPLINGSGSNSGSGQKLLLFSYFILIIYPQAHNLQS